MDRDSNIVYEGLEKYPETENIIFDITTNGGGSDGYWMENLVAPFGGTYEFGYRSFFKSTPLINKYYADSESKPVSELSDAPEWASELGLPDAINIDGTDYKVTEIVAGAFKNIHKAAKCKVPKKVLKNYQKFLIKDLTAKDRR